MDIPKMKVPRVTLSRQQRSMIMQSAAMLMGQGIERQLAVMEAFRIFDDVQKFADTWEQIRYEVDARAQLKRERG